jgi:hypothetical protein
MMLLLVLALARADEPHPVSLAHVELGVATGTLFVGDGLDAGSELAWRGVHLGIRALWNAAKPYEPMDVYSPQKESYVSGGYLVDGDDPWRGELRTLLTAGYYVGDRHLQVGAGLAAGPAFGFSRDLLVPSPDVDAGLYWTATLRYRVHRHLALWGGELARLDQSQFDGALGVGWLQ